MTTAVFPYAIVASDAAPSVLPTGLRGSSVCPVAADALAALASELESFQAEPEDLLVHHRVVEAACAAGPALPVRFGTRFRDRPALARALGNRQAALLAALRRVGGRREIAVTLEWSEAPNEQHLQAAGQAGGPGRRFLAGRAVRLAQEERRRERAEQLTHTVLDALGQTGILETDVKHRIVPSPRVALSCAVLTDAARAEDVMRRVREASAGWADVRLHLAGPWPPYSFSEPR